ncbi:hypothetical protein BV22DRAFT_987352, partial [Leucogyrophana mollusca]
LGSFNPFASHPFTNGSGIIPPPPIPSAYALPTKMPGKEDITAHEARDSGASKAPPPVAVSHIPTSIQAPKPRRHIHRSLPNQCTEPVFIPFRPEKASPEL